MLDLSALIATIDARLRWSVIPGAPRECQRDLDGYHAARLRSGESVKALAKEMHNQKGKRAVALVEAAAKRGREKKLLHIFGG
jgi:hypothetical protein